MEPRRLPHNAPTGLREGRVQQRYVALIVVVAFIGAVTAAAAHPGTALACDPGRTPGSATGGFAGVQRTLSSTPAGVKTRIETYNSHIYGNAAAWAWNMLTRDAASNGNQYWAQTGWAKWMDGSGFIRFSPFWSYTDNAGHYWVKYYTVTIGSNSLHNYYTYWLPGTLKFTFAYDSTTLAAGQTGGWTPTRVEVYGETHNYDTQMPGDINNKVTMDNAYYILSGGSTWYAINAAAGANKPDWYGATGSGSSFLIWDKACTTDGPLV